MALTRQQKKEIIEDLEEKIKKQNIIIFVDFSGLKVQDLFGLRKKLKSTNAILKVAKKTLLALALESYNSDLVEEISKLKGQVASILGFEEVLPPAKIIYQFSLQNPNLKILGGYLEGKFRETQEIITLAQLPTREGLLAQLVGTIAAPVTNFINVLQGNLKGLINIIANLSEYKSNLK